MGKKSFSELTAIFREWIGISPEMTDDALLNVRLGQIPGLINRKSVIAFLVLLIKRGVSVRAVVCEADDTVRDFLKGIEKDQY